MTHPRACALRDVEVLAMDCQATSSRPESGLMLELGWLPTCAADLIPETQIEEEIQSSLFRAPRKAILPPQVLKITGIEPEELRKAPTGREIWERVDHCAQETAVRNGSRLCPTVIHFRRYEEPFLKKLHAEQSGEESFPLDIVCTHQIMQRLFPGLPRKGLRAVAGYFGYSLPELRRSRHHVKATALIWRHLVRILEDEQGLTGFPELKDWLTGPGAPPSIITGKRVYPMEKRLREGLPDRPGVYRMYRLNGDILYVGKAKSLKQRVNSYFQPQGRHAEHILEMLSQAKDLTVTPTDTALEAALLEADEIKRLAPPFNRALQAHNRGISYASTDLRSFRSSSPDLTHPVGPLAAPAQVAPLGPLADLLSQQNPRIGVRMMENILDIPRDYLPDRATFRRGMRAFRDQYKDQIPPDVDLPTLLALGARFWKEKLAEKAALIEAGGEKGSDTPAADPGEDQEEFESDPGVWTEERVVKVLRAIVRTGTYQIRRRRWLLRLCESCLTWADREDPGQRHVVVLEGGRACFPGPIRVEAEAPVPIWHGRRLQDRRTDFDITTFDRLRILTTEIRRLCAEGRAPELCFHPPTRLSQPCLIKMLPWV
ncbi:MAG: GIY-YIG nuclease family protein [Candidatus Aminicenantaceae bacterium]